MRIIREEAHQKVSQAPAAQRLTRTCLEPAGPRSSDSPASGAKPFGCSSTSRDAARERRAVAREAGRQPGDEPGVGLDVEVAGPDLRVAGGLLRLEHRRGRRARGVEPARARLRGRVGRSRRRSPRRPPSRRSTRSSKDRSASVVEVERGADRGPEARLAQHARARSTPRRGRGTRRSPASRTSARPRRHRTGVRSAGAGPDPPRDDVGHRDVDALADAVGSTGVPTPRRSAARTPCRLRGPRPGAGAPRVLAGDGARARRRWPGSSCRGPGRSRIGPSWPKPESEQ